jgi:hypothetical protein
VNSSWPPGTVLGDDGDAPPEVGRAWALLDEAIASDDAEATGLRAAELVADPDSAVSLLGAPDTPVAARHAVVQRYGYVGALLVLGFEDRWRRLNRSATAGPISARRHPGVAELWPCLDRLIDDFARLDASELDTLLAEIDRAAGAHAGEVVGPPDTDWAGAAWTAAEPEARRWLHATYAVAARDGTGAAHRAYMDALDRLLRLARSRLAS